MNPHAYAALSGPSLQLSTEGRPLLTERLCDITGGLSSPRCWQDLYLLETRGRICFLLSRKLLLADSWQSLSLSTWRHKTPLSVSISLCFLSLCQFLTICPCETQLSSSPQVPRPSFFDLEAELAAVKSLLNAAFPLEHSLSCYGKCHLFPFTP